MIMRGLGQRQAAPIPRRNQRLFRERLIFTSTVNHLVTNLMTRIILWSSFLPRLDRPGASRAFRYEALVLHSGTCLIPTVVVSRRANSLRNCGDGSGLMWAGYVGQDFRGIASVRETIYDYERIGTEATAPIPRLNQRLLRERLIFTSTVNHFVTNLMTRIIIWSSFLPRLDRPGWTPGLSVMKLWCSTLELAWSPLCRKLARVVLCWRANSLWNFGDRGG